MWFLLFLIIVNGYAFYLMGEDKKRAKKHKWRISEAHLWLSALVFGALGSFLGMQFFRHKTKHTFFRIGMPFLVFIQMLLLGYVYSYL
ncbi:DUF1294 domain-containing protein [Bacillus sp. NPDC077027]|uniref:DUF1294 domain-containing protein n=1 Tax=Bacillus sp. NPDC077027 TaxID=3390548 RepID=UPI003D080CBF